MDTLASSPHPLMQFPILNQILNYTRFPDLLTMRQVCKCWNYQVNTFIRYKLRVAIIGNENLLKFSHILANSAQNFQCHKFEIHQLTVLGPEFSPAMGNLGVLIHQLHLHTNCINYPSPYLEQLIFDQLPSLQILTLEHEECNVQPQEFYQILPMNFGQKKVHKLSRLKSFHTIGDFCRLTDVVYEILKYSPNLKCIKVEKQNSNDDDLYGIWFFEILTSKNHCEFPYLECLEIDCAIIEIQLKAFIANMSFARLKRLCLDLKDIQHDCLEVALVELLGKFQTSLRSVEFVFPGQHNGIDVMFQKLVNRFTFCWIAFHRCKIGNRSLTSKILFSNRCYALEIEY